VPATVFHYARRRPELTTLYEVVRDNLDTLYAASDAGFVRSELEGYLECGLLCRGFAVMACTEPGCHARHLVAFSCKGRGFTAPAALPRSARAVVLRALVQLAALAPQSS